MPVNASSRSSTLERGGVTGEGSFRQSLAAYGGGARGRPLAFFACLCRSVCASHAKRQMPTSQGRSGSERSRSLTFDARYIFFSRSFRTVLGELLHLGLLLLACFESFP